ncbi:MAG: hypothetical protein Kow0092_33090 [Deferrisomatales bacterium]
MRAHLSWWAALAGAVLVQSALLPWILPAPWVPDLSRSLTLWVALTGLPRGGPVLAFAAGAAVDLVSGAPIGFHGALRLLLYTAARPFRGVFFDDRPELMPPFAALGAVADAGGAWVLSWVAFPTQLSLSVVFATAWRQALLDAFLVPGVFVALELAALRRPAPEVPQ